MTTHRIRPDAGWGVAKDHPRGENGRLLCRYCGVEVPHHRRTFCSDECVHEFKVRSNPAYARRQVFGRDRGVCAACGLDTESLQVELKQAGFYRSVAHHDRLVSLGFKPTAYRSGDFWQADHVLAVVEGGGAVGLSGLQTLCAPCHKRKTAELAARRSQQRRDAQQTEGATCGS